MLSHHAKQLACRHAIALRMQLQWLQDSDVALPVLFCRLPNYSRGIRQKLHRLCNESNWKVPAPAVLLGLMCCKIQHLWTAHAWSSDVPSTTFHRCMNVEVTFVK